ncbi:MAG: NAD(P)-binding domain-containing protein [Armatimonadetes bacterium]|nr:NAD(P)-binding domain-containing protein [Armatimonadota bacterium]
MKIGIIGAGSMGSALGKIWAMQGHHVEFSFTRDPNKLARIVEEIGLDTQVATPADAVRNSDVILIAVWPDALETALREAGSLSGKVVITCVSGLKPDMSGGTIGLPTDLTISMAEKIATLSPDAKVVEAFNTTFAEILAAPSRDFNGERPSVFYCGDDASAKVIVKGLVEECGYQAVDAGSLHSARALETLATAWVQFAVVAGLFPNLGLKALRW